MQQITIENCQSCIVEHDKKIREEIEQATARKIFGDIEKYFDIHCLYPVTLPKCDDCSKAVRYRCKVEKLQDIKSKYGVK